MIRVADVTDSFSPDWAALASDIDAIDVPPIQSIKMPGQDTWFGDWGGWGVMTKDASYKSAFASVNYVFHADGTIEAAKKRSFHGLDDVHWTDITTPSIKSAVMQVKRYGLFPTRARIAVLWPNSQGPWHADGEGEAKLYRLHFIIKTNPSALFEARDRTYHLAERRVYIFNTNAHHRITNFGDDLRIHIMMNLNMQQQVEKLCEGHWLT